MQSLFLAGLRLSTLCSLNTCLEPTPRAASRHSSAHLRVYTRASPRNRLTCTYDVGLFYELLSRFGELVLQQEGVNMLVEITGHRAALRHLHCTLHALRTRRKWRGRNTSCLRHQHVLRVNGSHNHHARQQQYYILKN